MEELRGNMTEQEIFLLNTKQYIDRFMYEGSKFHLSTQDIWIKQLYNIVQEQQKVIADLQEFISDRNDDIDFYIKVFKELNSVIKPIAEPDGYDY